MGGRRILSSETLTRTSGTVRLVIMLLLLLIAVSLPQVFSVTAQVGVKAGDWAHYSVGENPSGNITLVKSLLNQFSAYNNTQYASVNFTKVSGTNVNLTQAIHYTNRTILANSVTIDVSQGIDQTNPPIIITQNSPPLGNGLTNGTFFNVQRIINSLYVSPSQGNASRYTWDEETGVLISKQILYTVDANGSTGTFTFTLSMISTNLWYYVPPKNPSNGPPMPLGLQFAELYVIAGVVGSITVGVFAVRSKRRYKTRSRSKNGSKSSRSSHE
jgi:hypothetical protein